MLAGNWSTEIQIPGGPKINDATFRFGDRGIRVRRLGFFSPLKILSFWKRPG